MLTRRNVWDLGSIWASDTLRYPRGVKAMKAKALADRTSWRFYAAIHGINPELWALAGYLSGDVLPTDADMTTFWEHCQHGSWFFLPWHRGYVLAFEKCARAEIVKLGGPMDWALPYWNYFKPGQDAMTEDDFTGVPIGGSPGFSGVHTGFAHNERFAPTDRAPAKRSALAGPLHSYN
jgi:tyrosinase